MGTTYICNGIKKHLMSATYLTLALAAQAEILNEKKKIKNKKNIL